MIEIRLYARLNKDYVGRQTYLRVEYTFRTDSYCLKVANLFKTILLITIPSSLDLQKNGVELIWKNK